MRHSCNAMSESLWRGVGGPYWKRLKDPDQSFRFKNDSRDDREILGRHAIPDPVRNISASIRWEPKASPQVTVVSADGDPSLRRLSVSRVGEAIHFNVPSLDYWTTVVASTTWIDQLGSNEVKTK